MSIPRRFFLKCCGLLASGLLLIGGEARAITVTPVTSDNGYPAHEVDWTDADGLLRTAVLVDQNATTAPYTGYLRRYTYQVNGVTRTCTGTDNYATGGNLEFSGDGFVQNHTADGGDDSSGNGAGVPGTTTVNLRSGSHAIITFDMPGYTISGQTVPTTVQWFFADGRSHPVFSVCQDARATTGNLGADSRTPYGDMAYDGDGVHALVGGFSYGDTFQLFTKASSPEEVTMFTPWDATTANTIPYAMQWAESVTADAEMGHVATVPISVSDQGIDTQTSDFNTPPDLFDPRGKSGPEGPLPPANTWAFQIINYNLPAQGPTDSKRLAWGTQFGRVGGFDNYGDASLNVTQYSQHSTDPVDHPLTGTRADGLLMAYSTFIVLGTHHFEPSGPGTDGGENTLALGGTMGRVVRQMENAARATLTATVGTVAVGGPAGVGNAVGVTAAYTPAGYNPTFAGWEASAVGDALDVTLTPTAGTTLAHPVFIVDGYTGATLPGGVAINGTVADEETDYFQTLDTANQRLLITLNRSFASAVEVQIIAPGNPGPSPTPTATPVPTATPTVTPTPTAPPVPTPTIAPTPTPTAPPVPTPTVTPTPTPTPTPVNAPVITSATSATGQVGAAFTYRIVATNSPASYFAGDLPAGLSFDAGTGIISGKPTAVGSIVVGIGARNAGGTGVIALTITIDPAPKPPLPKIKLKLKSVKRNGPKYFATVAFVRAGAGIDVSENLKVAYKVDSHGVDRVKPVTSTATVLIGPGMTSANATIEYRSPRLTSADYVKCTVKPKATYKVAAPGSVTVLR